MPAIWIVQIGQRRGEYPVRFRGVDRIERAGLAPEGDNCGDVEIRDGNMKARKGDQRVDAARVRGQSLRPLPARQWRRDHGRWPPGSHQGRRSHLDGSEAQKLRCSRTTSGPSLVSWRSTRTAAWRSAIRVASRVVGVELARCARCGARQRLEQAAGNGDGVIRWSGRGQPVVHGVRRRGGRIWHRSVHHAELCCSLLLDALLFASVKVRNVGLAVRR